jgi:hypothetical protein
VSSGGGGGSPAGGAASGGTAGGSSGSSSAGSGGSDGCTHVELLQNPAFDLGLDSWVTQSQSGAPAIVGESVAPVSAHSPPNLAWLGGSIAVDDWISQVVAVTPANATLKVSFFILIETLETDANAYDVIAVKTYIGTEVQTHLTLSNVHANSGYAFYEVDIPPVLAGTSIDLSIETSNDGSQPTAFYVDSLSFTAQTCD